MPEIPDIEIFAANLEAQFAGKELKRVRVVQGAKLPQSQRALTSALKGRKLEAVRRSGKELRWHFSGGTVLGMHLMLTGDVFVFDGKNTRSSTIVELQFVDGSGIALTDRMKNARVFLNPDDKSGIDALDRRLNYRSLRKILQRKAQVKNVLLDQHLIRGIGNGYSDEILWRARISPFSVAASIPDDKIRVLARAIKSVLRGAIRKIRRHYPGKIQGEVRDFMEVHAPGLEKSPTGRPIKVAKRGMLKTYYTDEQVLYT